jgi:hypothetical protein
MFNARGSEALILSRDCKGAVVTSKTHICARPFGRSGLALLVALLIPVAPPNHDNSEQHHRQDAANNPNHNWIHHYSPF